MTHRVNVSQVARRHKPKYKRDIISPSTRVQFNISTMQLVGISFRANEFVGLSPRSGTSV